VSGIRLGRAAVFAAALALAGGALASGAVLQQGNLRVTVLAQVKPYKLPRNGTAPIAVFVAGHLAAVDGGTPPQLKRLDIKVNRHGLLQSKGLPLCKIPQIQPASTERALDNCGEALVGSGQFWAHIILPGQEPYPSRGRLLIFNSRKKGKPVLLAHIFTANPFANSFVITFDISRIRKGSYGTMLSASLPRALGSWGYVDRIKLTLRRKYRVQGRQLSYFNAGCPAPKGTKSTVFQLAEAKFAFKRARAMRVTVAKSCRVKK